jgi:hypothetical protein
MAVAGVDSPDTSTDPALLATEVKRVQAQIRIYTINRGELDNWLTHFREETLPVHEAVGWPVVAMWVNRPQNEVIWIRTHQDAADLEAKTKAFREEAAARGIQLGGTVAKMEVREVEAADIPVSVS